MPIPLGIGGTAFPARAKVEWALARQGEQPLSTAQMPDCQETVIPFRSIKGTALSPQMIILINIISGLNFCSLRGGRQLSADVGPALPRGWQDINDLKWFGGSMILEPRSNCGSSLP